MKCMNCAHYKICKSLNNTGIKVKESEKKNATISFNRVTSNPCR